MACKHHPGSASVTVINGWSYCARCQTGMTAAAALVDGHVTPRDCFVWYKNATEGWAPIQGTGCAHYVAHQLNIRLGGPGATCLEGYLYRVPLLLTGRTAVTGGLTSVAVNDIWVSAARDHTGLVSRIDAAVPAAAGRPATPLVIWITHASSAQGRLATNRFDTYFHARGDFFR